MEKVSSMGAEKLKLCSIESKQKLRYGQVGQILQARSWRGRVDLFFS